MIFLGIIIAILFISLGLSLLSLRKLSHQKEVEHVKKDLNRSRVLFQYEDSSSVSSSS
ncbi:MAG TPA: hypothetical protein VLF68_00030 [Candidatus Saccharimonadales bacterium]|nr:hypothetical protein [Candidatus Saccharimonadales bacterium]